MIISIDDIGRHTGTREALKGVDSAMLANQGLMGISGVKQWMNLTGHKMPSMNYTHYVRFVREPEKVLEWLLRCNFLPLFYTGNSTNKEECLNAQFS